jgi:hypothetical protein
MSHHFGGVVIREGHAGSSSVPPRVKKEAPVKDELEEEPAQEEDERPWWVKEIALADTAHHPDDPADEPGFHLLQ